jgi:hypothetical protein
MAPSTRITQLLRAIDSWACSRFMRRQPVVKQLGDEFGDYLLTIECRQCKHKRVAEPRSLAKLVGWEITLDALAKRLRCSSCHEKDCELTPNSKPRPRGKDFR